MSFQDFHFPDVKQVALEKGLVFTGWVPFHQNTEFKARAAIYHFERLLNAYREYAGKNPLPGAHTIFNYFTPLKETVFFEFLAVITNLVGAFDSLLQEINCAYKLGLNPHGTKRQKHVTFKDVKKRLRETHPKSTANQELAKLGQRESAEHSWFRFLKQMRNVAIHSDIYTTSAETKDLSAIFNEIENLKEVAQTQPIPNEQFSRVASKRDITIKVGDDEYFMLRLTIHLKDHMLEYVGNFHALMTKDKTILPP